MAQKVRTPVFLDEDLHREAKILAAAEGKNLSKQYISYSKHM